MHVVIFSSLYFLCIFLDKCPGLSTTIKGPRSQSVSEKAGDKTIFLHSIRKSLHDPLPRPPDGLSWTADSLFWCNCNVKWVCVYISGVGVGWEKNERGFLTNGVCGYVWEASTGICKNMCACTTACAHVCVCVHARTHTHTHTYTLIKGECIFSRAKVFL